MPIYQPNLNIAGQMPFMAGPASGNFDVNQFLKSATQQMEELGNIQKNAETARQTIGGTGRSSQLADRLAQIDQGTQSQVQDLISQIAQAKAQQQYEQDVYNQQKNEAEDAIKKEQEKATALGTGQEIGSILGALPGLVAAPFTGGATLPLALQGFAAGGQIGQDVAGVPMGAAPSFDPSKIFGQQAFGPNPNTMPDWLKAILNPVKPAVTSPMAVGTPNTMTASLFNPSVANTFSPFNPATVS